MSGQEKVMMVQVSSDQAKYVLNQVGSGQVCQVRSGQANDWSGQRQIRSC